MSTPLIAPQKRPMASTIGKRSHGSPRPRGANCPAIMTVVKLMNGPIERSRPPLPESSGRACAIAVMMNGVATASVVVTLLERNSGCAITLATNSTTATSVGATA